MALMNQFCGPKASPLEDFNHRFMEFPEFFSCMFCGEQMSHAEAQEWIKKYGHKIEPVPPEGRLREGSS